MVNIICFIFGHRKRKNPALFFTFDRDRRVWTTIKPKSIYNLQCERCGEIAFTE